MKKFLALSLSALLVLALMAGCTTGAPAADDTPAPTPETQQDAATNDTANDTAGDTPAAEPAAEPVSILIAAAASLEYSLKDELIPLFQEQYPHITVEGTYASSGNLQTQIEEGMGADLFFSAAMTQMNNLDGQSLMDSDSIVQLLENRIVLIVPAGAEAGISSFEDLVNVNTVALGDPESVPVGQYSREALTNLGIYDAVAAKASLGTDVTQVLNWVAEGSADAGIVYATDAATTQNVTVVAEAPQGSLETGVIYPAGIVAASQNKDAAGLFLEFLQSPEATAVFQQYGFAAA